VPLEVAKYSLKERRRLDVKPGLTCFWQVEGRGDVPFSQQVEMDIRYIDSQGIWLDVLLILKTIPAVLFGKGAY
jgi:lipopolysaccharide/colanic/teichoic acid biosynthesis glycosyltransferase